MNPRYRLAVGWLTLFMVGTDLFVVSPLLPLIARELDLSTAAVGLCATVFSLCYMLSAPVFGTLADRLGRRRTLTACLVGFALANLCIVGAGNFASLLILRGLAGITAAGISPLIYAGVGEAAPAERRGRWMAFAVSGLLLALSLGAPLGSLIGVAWGWRAPFAILAGLSLVLALCNRIVWPPRASAAVLAAVPLLPLDTRALVRSLTPTVLWATALYGVYTYLGVGLTGIGLSPPQIARAIGLYGIGALAGTLIGGQLADRIGPRRTVLASLAGLAAGLLGIGTFLHGEFATEVLLLLTSVMAQLFFPAQQAGLARDFPGRRATVLAWNNSALFLGISLGSLIGGEAVERAGFAAAALVGIIIAAAAFAVVAVSTEEATTIQPPIYNNILLKSRLILSRFNLTLIRRGHSALISRR